VYSPHRGLRRCLLLAVSGVPCRSEAFTLLQDSFTAFAFTHNKGTSRQCNRERFLTPKQPPPFSEHARLSMAHAHMASDVVTHLSRHRQRPDTQRYTFVTPQAATRHSALHICHATTSDQTLSVTHLSRHNKEPDTQRYTFVKPQQATRHSALHICHATGSDQTLSVTHLSRHNKQPDTQRYTFVTPQAATRHSA
jgi:hypothetical protein